MLRGFLFDLWCVACLYGHGFKSETCRWVQCPGFVCISPRYDPLSLQPWGWEMPLPWDGEAGGCGWVVGGSLCQSSPWRSILRLCPQLERERVRALAECFPFASGLSSLTCKRSNCFHRKAVFVEWHIILRASASYFSSSSWPCAFLHPSPTNCISFNLTKWYFMTQ